ncbi:hypothetical protein CSA56_13325 [candidate division KSB3 bacterium]|uniref:Uncharacterized protein n=1 Tax=candidate division KSB3 bacterium TaxID=2044937 RepID=A0A2G6KCD4_9BACT|nr:MAG: hypothetical protein CSA56_13325 [candidate division KSB3 bacterium]
MAEANLYQDEFIALAIFVTIREGRFDLYQASGHHERHGDKGIHHGGVRQGIGIQTVDNPQRNNVVFLDIASLLISWEPDIIII